MLNEELVAIFHGEVHNVGFRATAKRTADQLNIVGYAQNLPDGTVEVCAQGPKNVLEVFVQRLLDEFIVSKVEITYRSVDTSWDMFFIKRE